MVARIPLFGRALYLVTGCSACTFTKRFEMFSLDLRSIHV